MEEYFEECVKNISKKYNLEEDEVRQILFDDFGTVVNYSGKIPEFDDVMINEFGLNPLHLKDMYNLQKHQIMAIQYMRHRESEDVIAKSFGIRGGLIGFEMGMGKSLTAASYIEIAKTEGSLPSLIVTPLAILNEWKDECYKKFFKGSGIRVLFYHPDVVGGVGKKYVSANRAFFNEFDVVITTYDILKKAFDKQKVKKLGNRYEGAFEEYVDGSIYNNIVMPAYERGKPVAIDYIRERQEEDIEKHATGSLALYYTKWERVICDEIQKSTNESTLTYLALMGLCAKYKWGLTGTPIRNKAADYFSELRFLGFNAFVKHSDWSKNIEKHMIRYKPLSAIYFLKNEDVGIVLPQKTIIHHNLQLTLKERYYIQCWLKEIIISKNAIDTDTNYILVLFTRLRQSGLCPILTKKNSQDETAKFIHNAYEEYRKARVNRSNSDETPEVKSDRSDKSIGDTREKFNVTPGSAILPELSTLPQKLKDWLGDVNSTAGINSTKIRRTVSIIKNEIPAEDSVIIFSTFSSVFPYVQKQLKKINVTSEFINGEIKGSERRKIIANFRSKKIRCLLINYSVGAEGLNLTVANHCIFMDQWWNDAIHKQAEARVYRSGQTKPTFMHYLRAINSIDIGMQILCIHKTNIATQLLSGNITNKLATTKVSTKYSTYDFMIQKAIENLDEVDEEDALGEEDEEFDEEEFAEISHEEIIESESNEGLAEHIVLTEEEKRRIKQLE